MNLSDFFIHPEIEKAHTLPTTFYKDETIFKETINKIFAKCWHFTADTDQLSEPGTLLPITLLPQVLNEPLLLTTTTNGDHLCLSNVCTHRGKVLVEEKCTNKRIISCGYHGRCFALDGKMKSMPEFNGVVDFPASSDHLKQFPLTSWAGMLWSSISPSFDFLAAIQPLLTRVGFLPLNEMMLEVTESTDYPIKANWALYCDNYLEGFHIPFVHPALNEALSFQNYEYHLFDYSSLQVGIAKDGEPHFDLPEGHIDYGKKIYGYYFFLFPNIMLNFYPWGLSLNLVQPQDISNTIVSYRTYYFDKNKGNRAVNAIDKTELEDQSVVESVQKGIQSNHYDRGRFSPTMERAVHHFHRLISDFLTKKD